MENTMREVSRHPPIAEMLERMMANPIEGTVQAHSLLSTDKLKEWERGLCLAGMEQADEAELEHYLVGCPALSDPISGESWSYVLASLHSTLHARLPGFQPSLSPSLPMQRPTLPGSGG
jgi:hypothetical protein